MWKPSDAFTGDLRLSADRLETRAFYFVIPRADEANPFSTFSTPPDANNTTRRSRVNNPGEDNRDLCNAALKLDFKTGARHAHLDLRLRQDQGDPHRRCLRLPPAPPHSIFNALLRPPT